EVHAARAMRGHTNATTGLRRDLSRAWIPIPRVCISRLVPTNANTASRSGVGRKVRQLARRPCPISRSASTGRTLTSFSWSAHGHRGIVLITRVLVGRFGFFCLHERLQPEI